ncbi:hypothetical protein BX600DRAFT_451229 [Xylariales sp. PMI_506]|nr:hypothetical protein BX600DRAFT_451229 [Xylariales sp. PMI_506]
MTTAAVSTGATDFANSLVADIRVGFLLRTPAASVLNQLSLSWFELGIGMLLLPRQCLTIFIGGLAAALLWRWQRSAGYVSSGVPVAAALMAGESMAGVRSRYGTNIGCPTGIC